MRRFLLILFVLIIAVVAVWYFVIRPKQQAAGTGEESGFRSFLSLGNKNPDATPSTDTTVQGTEQVGIENLSVSPFTKVSTNPIAGFTTYTVTRVITIPATDPKQKPIKQTITEHIIRYVSRANGYVYEIKDGGIATQITNIFIPNIYEASFADNNQTAILRFLRDDDRTIATYSVPIPEQNPDGTRTQRDGTYLPENIDSLAVSPDQKTLARLTTDPAIAVVTTSDSKGGNIKSILQSTYHEWLLSWANQPYVQTKASASANGFLYKIDAANKRLVRVLGSIPGLTASVSPKGTFVLYSQSNNTSFSTKLLATKTGSTKDLSVSILPEKCAWLASEDAICAGNTNATEGTYPDDWYKGTVSFSDGLYRIYTTGGLIDTLYTGDTTSFDMINLSYDESTSRLYFIDKNTGLLWQYAL